MNTILKNIQEGVSEKLLTDPYFSDVTEALSVPVLSENLKDIANRIDSALNKIGRCVLVLTPTAQVAHPNMPGPYFSNIAVECEVTELVTVNRTGLETDKVGPEIAEHCASLIHHYRPEGINEVLNCEGISLVADPMFLIYRVRFFTQGGMLYEVPKVTLSAANNGGVVSFTAVPDRSLISYTLDGTYPVPRNPSTVIALASEPPTLGTGQTLKARAWMPGYLASDLVSVSG